MPRLRERIPTETDSPASRLRKTINPGPPAKRQRIPGSGRRPGTSNQIPRHTQALILEALHTYGEDGSGRGGVIGLLHGAFREDIKHAIHLLVAITPKLLEADVTVRSAPTVKTIEELARLNLPKLPELFAPDWRGDPVENEVVEAEVSLPK